MAIGGEPTRWSGTVHTGSAPLRSIAGAGVPAMPASAVSGAISAEGALPVLAPLTIWLGQTEGGGAGRTSGRRRPGPMGWGAVNSRSLALIPVAWAAS